MLKRIAEFQQEHPKLLFGLFLISVVLLAAIAVRLEIDPSFSALVGKESEYNTNDRILTTAFDRNDAILILVKEDPTTTLTNAKRLDEIDAYLVTLEETIAQSQYVRQIRGPEFDEEERYARYVLTLYAPEKPDGFKEVLSQFESLVAASGPPPGIQVSVTGLPILLDRISTLLITDNLITVLITLTFIMLILYGYGRSLRFAFMAIVPPAFSLLALAAVMVLLDIEVTITLAAVGVLVLGLGADYSIHIVTHYRHARRKHESHKQALLQTVDELTVPITASFFTTLGGFAALILGVSPSSVAQGIALALAIVIIYLTTFLVFPLLVALFGKNLDVKPNPIFNTVRDWLTKLAVIQTHHPKKVIAIVGLITVVMIFGASKVEFSTSNSNWIPDDDPVAVSFREVNSVYGDEDTITLLFIAEKGDLRDVQTARDVNRLAAMIAQLPNIDTITNPYEDVPYDNTALHEHITGNPAFNNDYTLTTLSVTSSNLEQDEAGDSILLQEIRVLTERFPVHDARMTLYGDPVRFEELGDSLEQDATKTTLVGFAVVFLVASLIYASIVIGILALLPIIIAIIWALGLMGFFGVPFTSLSTSIISLVLGIGVDFSIHLVDGIKRYLRKGIEKAITLTMEGAGSAIVLSSLTTFVGFLALTFAQLLGTQRLGWSLAFSIVSVLIVSITLVPAVMALGRKVKQ